jgi:ketosteroid isomerase-like protein
MSIKTAALVGFATLMLTETAMAATQSSDEQAIRADLALITKSYQNRDAVGTMAPYAKDADLPVLDLTPPIVKYGYAGSLQTTQDFINSTVGPITIAYSDIHIIVDDKHAYGWYIVHNVATYKNGQKKDIVLRTSDVFEKRNGKWLIIMEHNSVPVNVITGMADFHSDTGPDRFNFGSN